jgi:hypothetical protein
MSGTKLGWSFRYFSTRSPVLPHSGRVAAIPFTVCNPFVIPQSVSKNIEKLSPPPPSFVGRCRLWGKDMRSGKRKKENVKEKGKKGNRTKFFNISQERGKLYIGRGGRELWFLDR